jgi:hypothetical protein
MNAVNATRWLSSTETIIASLIMSDSMIIAGCVL